MVRGAPTIPTLSQTFPALVCWSVLPRDPAELAAHAQVATWEWASPQPTMAGRVGSFSNLRGSLPPQDPCSVGSREGCAISVFANIPSESDAGPPEHSGDVAWILHHEGLDLEASSLTSLSLKFPHL